MKKRYLATLLSLSTLAIAQAAFAENAPQAQPNTEQNQQDEHKHKHKEHKKHKHAHCEMMAKMPMDHIHAQFRNQPYHGEASHFQPWQQKMGGFSQLAATTVADAEKWQDDQLVMLEGQIVKQVGKKAFVFKDQTGELSLDIDRKAWRGVINPEDKVKVLVEVEKSWGKTELEALSVEKLKELQPQNPADKAQ